MHHHTHTYRQSTVCCGLCLATDWKVNQLCLTVTDTTAVSTVMSSRVRSGTGGTYVDKSHSVVAGDENSNKI